MSESKEMAQRAAEHTAQARAIDREFTGKPMPLEAAKQMNQHLTKASEFRRRAELAAHEAWLREPQYKHDMVGGAGFESKDAGGFDSVASLDYEYGRGGPSAESVKAIADFARGRKAALVEDSTGQSVVPVDYAGTIVKELARRGVIRNLATVHPTSSDRVDVGSVRIAGGGWGKVELGATLADGMDNPAAAKDTIDVHDLTALIKIGVDELEDADASLEALIREAVVQKFAEQEDDAFAFGTGSAMPFGIGTRAKPGAAPGGVITQGFAAAAGETVVADDVRRLQYQVPQWARDGGVYLGSPDVEQAVSLLKDSTGAYYWKDPERVGDRPSFAGKPWFTLGGLPAMLATDDTGAGTNPSLVFGDVRLGYMIADRRRITVRRLVERFIDEGKIGLLFSARCGGDVVRPAAFARLLL